MLLISLFVVTSLTEYTIATSTTITTIGTKDYDMKSVTVKPKANGDYFQKVVVEMVAPSDSEFPFFSSDNEVIKGSTNGDTTNYLLKYNIAIGSVSVWVQSPSQSSSFFAIINITNPGLNPDGNTILNIPNCEYNVVKLSDGSKVRYEVVDKCGQWPGPGFKKEVYFEAIVKTPKKKVLVFSIDDGLGRWEKYFGKYEGIPSIKNSSAYSVFVNFGKLRENGSTLQKIQLKVDVLPNEFGAKIYNALFLRREIH